MKTNRDKLNTIPNKYFHSVYTDYILRLVGLNATDTGIAIGKWLDEPYDENDYVWQNVKRFLQFIEDLEGKQDGCC